MAFFGGKTGQGSDAAIADGWERLHRANGRHAYFALLQVDWGYAPNIAIIQQAMSILRRQQEELSVELQQHQPSATKHLGLNDPYILISCLQKALRRGESCVAIAAGRSLLATDPARLWRRLVICAFEDLGLTDLDLTARVVAAASDKRWRASVGGDDHVMSYLIELLAAQPRDRRTDSLYMLAVRHVLHPPSRSDFLAQKPSEALTDLALRAGRIVVECEQAVPYRAIRAVRAYQCDQALHRMTAEGIMDEYLRTICAQGRRTSMCLLPVLLPLARRATETVGCQSVIVSGEVPEVRQIGEVPSYALCGFTRVGQEALAHLARSDGNVARVVRALRGKARSDALTYVLFEAEGGLCSLEMSDLLYDELKALALGCWTGLPRTAVPEAIEIMRAAIPALNNIRADMAKAAP